MQYVALGTVFEDVAGGEIAVKDVVKVGVPAGGGSLSSGTDQIWRWNTETASWTKYFWYSSRGTTLWAKQGEKVETTDKIPAGETFFFLRAGGAATTSLTLAGAVKQMEGAVSTTVSAMQLAFMANPWPTPIAVKDFSSLYTAGTPAGGGSLSSGTDQIWRWNREASTWTKYFYYSSRGTTLWALQGQKVATEDTIPGGEGFFFQRAGGASQATLTITAPSK